MNTRGSSTGTNRYATAFVLFTLFLFLALLPLWIHNVEPRWDARDWQYPALTYVTDSYAEGRFPLWDPYTNCGQPFHAYPDSPILNPIAVTTGMLNGDTGDAFTSYWYIVWLLGGAGTFLWARFHRATPEGALCSALAFSFSGYYIGHAEHTSYLWAVTCIPWIFLLAESAMATGNLGWALLSGVAMGFSALGGYASIYTFTPVALAFWLGLEYLPSIPSLPVTGGFVPVPGRERLRRYASTLAIIGLVFVSVSSPMVHSFFRDAASYSERVAPLDVEYASYANPFSPLSFFSVMFPRSSLLLRQWLGTDIPMGNGYLGAITVPMMALFFLRGEGRFSRFRPLLFISFMFLLSLGGHAGIRTILYYIFPPMRHGYGSAIYRAYWILPAALLGGLGVSLLRDPANRKRAVRLLALWTGIAAGVAALLAGVLSNHGLSQAIPLPGTWLPTLVILPLALLGFILWKPERKYGRLLPVCLLLPAVGFADAGIHLYNNSETVWIQRDSIRWAESLHRRSTLVLGPPEPRLPPLFFGWFNAQQVLKKPVVRGFTSLRSKGYDEVLCASRYRDVLAAPFRFWLSPGTESYPDPEAVLAELSRLGPSDPLPAFLNGASPLPPVRSVPGSFGRVRVVSYAPETVELEVEAPAPSGGFLASTERASDGWKVFVDGAPATPATTNLYFRGVLIPPGQHRVVWSYRPELWRPLALFSVAVMILASGLGGFLVIRSRKGSSPGISGTGCT